MADWVTGKVAKVQNWTDALFSLTVHAPVLPFTAGQFTKLGLEIEGERVQRLLPMLTRPIIRIWVYTVTVPDGKLSPRLAALKPGDEVQVVSEAAGSLCWMKYQIAKRYGCWQPVQRLYLFIDSAIGQRFRTLQKHGAGSRRTICRRLKLSTSDAGTGKKRYEGNCAFRRWSVGKRLRVRSLGDYRR